MNPSREYFGEQMAHTIIEHEVETSRAQRKTVPIKAKKPEARRPRSTSTVKHELAVLKEVFNKGIAWGLVDRNPAARVKPLPESKGRTRFLSVEEAEKLVQAASAHLRPIIIMALETGMRRGEILRLKWEDLDMKNNMIYIADPKNNDPRHVPMSSRVKALLASLPRRLRADYVFVGVKKWQMVGKDGIPFTDVDTSFRNACAKEGIEDFTFHGLRHTAASHLVMSGVPLRTVGEILGHKTATMTERYSHLTPEHKRNAIETLSSCYNSATIAQEAGR